MLLRIRPNQWIPVVALVVASFYSSMLPAESAEPSGTVIQEHAVPELVQMRSTDEPDANDSQMERADLKGSADSRPSLALQSDHGLRLKDAGVEAEGGYSSTGSLLEMLFGLVLVLAVFLGSAWLMKRFNQRLPGHASAITIRSVLAVGAKEKLLLVDVEGETLLLGVTQSSITTLHRLQGEERDTPVTEEANQPFSRQIESLLRKDIVNDKG